MTAHAVQEKFKKGNYGCLVLAVSSHGEEKYNENDVGSFEIIWKHRGRKQNYQINKLFKLFDETDDLQDKKKIFLLQMCRNRNDKSTVTRDGRDPGVSHSLQVKFNQGNYDCLVLAVSSHGKEKDNGKDVGSFEIVWGNEINKHTYQINDLFKLFDETDDKQDKKKIFLLQMCRNRNDKNTVTGDGTDRGVLYSKTNPVLHQPSDTGTLHESASEGSFLQERNVVWPKTWKIPQFCIKNSIAFFSAPSGFKSYTIKNSDQGGGWLFVCMINVVDDLKETQISVMDLFLMVNKKMSQMETTEDGHVVVSSFNHMLTEDIFINIKKH